MDGISRVGMMNNRPYRHNPLDLERRRQNRHARLPVPSWLPERASVPIQAACLACQETMDIRYGAAECSICPLADLVKRLNRN